MGIVGRLIAPGLVISIHTVPPGSHGAGEIGRSRLLPAGSWSEGDGYVRNLTSFEVTATDVGTPRYLAVLVDGRIRASGPLHRTGYLVPGDVAIVERGDVTVRWSDG